MAVCSKCKTVLIRCSDCNGSGKQGMSGNKCPKCNGTGSVCHVHGGKH
jgi:DnaJ-class molecular chaperone